MALAIDSQPGESPEEQAAAFTALYREFSGPLLAFSRRLTGPDGDPEGLAHEALLRAWASWDPSNGRPFWPWLVTVTRRLSIDHFRKVARRRAGLYAELELSTGNRFPHPEEQAERDEEHETVRQAFARLPESYQRVVRMRHVEGLSYDQIATSEGTTTEAVRGTLRRARQALRAAYTRIEVGVPALVALGSMRRARARFDDWILRLQLRLGASPELAATEAFKGTVVLVVVLATGAPLATAPGPALRRPTPEVAAPSPSSDVAASPQPLGGGTGAAAARAADNAFEEAEHVPPVPPSPFAPLLGDDVTTPEQAAFTDFTPSPNPSDRTVFAAGNGFVGCSRPNCPVLFRSADAGQTWQRLPAVGYFGGRVLLPPAWPSDPRIFVVGPRALGVSSDGGATFRNITPAGRSAAMSPGFSSGDPHIWVGFLPGWDYDDRDGLVRPVNLWPLPTADFNTFAFSPAWPADSRVAVGSWRPSTGSSQQGTVTVCARAKCPAATALPGIVGAPEVVVPDVFLRSGIAFAWSPERLYRTTNGGDTFRALDLPADAKVTSVVAGPDDRLYLTMADLSENGLAGGLFVSPDWGTTWRRLGQGTPLDGGASSVTPFADGRLVAAPHALANGGLLCSQTNGRTWSTRCS